MRPENSIRTFTLFFLMGLLVLSGCATIGDNPTTSTGVSPAQKTQETVEPPVLGVHIKDVTLEKMKGRERVSILLSEAADFDITRESENILGIYFRDVSIPETTQKEYGGGSLRNLKSVTLSPKTAESGGGAYARVLLKKLVPYRYRKDDTQVVIDFDVSTLSYEKPTTAGYVQETKPATAAKAPATPRKETDAQPEKIIQYTGEKMTLDFQDADIKSVFRLISEVSGYNIVAGPDVKGDVTANMKDVPWDQALDTILEVNGLGKKQSGKVITVLPLAELKKAEEEQQKKDVAQGRLNQISIEAKIVEVSTNFSSELGIKWGYGYKDKWGQKDYGVMVGTSASGALTTLPNGIGLTDSNVAVNFPSVSTVATPALGLVMGTSKFILDAQLSALEDTGDVKIVSSPKVTTLDGVKATIKQGEQIPYKVIDDNGKANTEFKDAVLQLEVTPTITPEGRISIEVKANNDYADWTRTTEEPPIKTNSVESTVVVADGDTIVIGGIYYTTESNSKEGVPWLSDIPVLGWLFKTKSVTNEKRELLIFVTPRIIGEEG
ncbi:MAG TPA: secretin and TonB N-terminal domain-containing protein [Syntrophales bacterium]|nr:secretin and TonB N-terminal domain-containing protein [Syntrophales bacterium]HPQ43290.1 secretin and TonB N-terminal domain-containing protein [Syntrophales bacterium]